MNDYIVADEGREFLVYDRTGNDISLRRFKWGRGTGQRKADALRKALSRRDALNGDRQRKEASEWTDLT